jgi:hypothetical protein
VVKERQRVEGSGPPSSTRSRGARGTRATKTSTVGQMISRTPAGPVLTFGRTVWKS